MVSLGCITGVKKGIAAFLAALCLDAFTNDFVCMVEAVPML
jgi:hypothetical protein